MSASAFLAGLLQNSYNENGVLYGEKAQEHFDAADKIEREAKRMYDFDQLTNKKTVDLITEAWVLAWEYDVTESDLSVSEQFLLLTQIYLGLYRVVLEVSTSFSFQLAATLEFGTGNIHTFATEDNEGYDFLIYRSEYEDNPALSWQTYDTFMDDWGFPNSVTSEVETMDTSNNRVSFFYSINLSNLNDLLFIPLSVEVQWGNDDLETSKAYLDSAENLKQSVSVTTVAVILATSMQARVNEKDTEKYFEEILEALYETRKGAKVKSDLVTFPTLAIALILSLSGLFLSFF